MGTPFDPMIFFSDVVDGEDDMSAPEEILEVERTSGNLSTFVEVVMEYGF